MTTAQGHCDERFREVLKLLEEFVASGEETGASIVVNENGVNVVDIWAGYKDEARTAPWTQDTIVNTFSTTKTITALAALILIDRGLLDVSAKVSKYWPEFAQNGKENTEIRHILSHTSGLPSWSQTVTLQEVCDLPKSTKLLEEQEPWWEPGSSSGYHPFSFGHLIGELVRRRTGKTLKQFIAEDIAKPLAADFQLGLSPSDLERVSDVIPPAKGPLKPNDGTVQARVQANPEFHPGLANSKLWRDADLGGGNGHGNARSVSRILSIISMMGKINDSQFLSKDTVELIFQEQHYGTDLVIQAPARYGVGFGLTGEDTFVDWLPTGRVCFWGGHGGSIAIMDLDRQLTFVYVMNKMVNVGLGSERTKAYVKAVYDSFSSLK